MRLFEGVLRLSRSECFGLFGLAMLIQGVCPAEPGSVEPLRNCYATNSTSHDNHDCPPENSFSRPQGKGASSGNLPSHLSKRIEDNIFDHLEAFLTDWDLVTPPYPHTVESLPSESGNHVPFVSDACPTVQTVEGPQRSPLCIQVRPNSPHDAHHHSIPGTSSVDGQRVWEATGRSAQQMPLQQFRPWDWRGSDPPQELSYDHYFPLSGIGYIGRWHWTVPAHRPNELMLELDMYWPEAVYAWRKVRGTTLLDLWINFEIHYNGASVKATQNGHDRIMTPPISATRDSAGNHLTSTGHPISEGSWRFSLVHQASNIPGRPESRALVFDIGQNDQHTQHAHSSGDQVNIRSRFVVQWRAVALEMGTVRPSTYRYQPARQKGKFFHPKNPKYYTPSGHKNPANWVPAPNHGYHTPAHPQRAQSKGKEPLHNPEPIHVSDDDNDYSEIFGGLEPLESLSLLRPPYPRRADLLPGESSSSAPVVAPSCPSNNDYAHARPGSPLCFTIDAALKQQVWTSVRNAKRFSVDNWLSGLEPHIPSFVDHRIFINHPEIGSFGDFVWERSAEEPGHIRLRVEIDWSQLQTLWSHARQTTLLEFQLEYQVYFATTSIKGKPAIQSTISYADRQPIAPLRTISSWSARPENDHLTHSGEWRFTETESSARRKPYERTLVFDSNLLRDKTRLENRFAMARQMVVVFRIVAKEQGHVILANAMHRWKRPNTGGPIRIPKKKGRRPPYAKPSQMKSRNVIE